MSLVEILCLWLEEVHPSFTAKEMISLGMKVVLASWIEEAYLHVVKLLDEKADSILILSAYAPWDVVPVCWIMHYMQSEGTIVFIRESLGYAGRL